MMDLERFTDTVFKEVRKKTTGNVEMKKIRKNNGVEMDGLWIQEDGSNIFPIVYLNPYYFRYLDGRSIEQIADDIYAACAQKGAADNFDARRFADFAQAKSNLVYRLVNYERNELLLQEVPHRRFLDLAIVFCYLVRDADDKGQTSILVHNEHLARWGVGIEDIEALAYENTPRLLGYDFISMRKVLGELYPHGQDGETSYPNAGNLPEMMILTNRNRINGASCLLYPDILAEFSRKMDSNLVILPSSIHEVILVPVKENAVPDREEFCRMICKVNETQVADAEVLSDHPYFYDRTTAEISAA